MRREIRIGLHADGDAAAGWIRVLRQDRLPWDRTDGPDRPIIIFDGTLPFWFEEFAERGGVAVVTGAPRADALLGPGIVATLTRFRPPDRDHEVALPCLARLFDGQGAGEIRVHQNRKGRAGNLADVRPAVLARPHGAGWLLFTGLPLATHLVASGDNLRAFTEASNVTERVATVDKAEVADTMTICLSYASPATRRRLPRSSCSGWMSMACSGRIVECSPKWPRRMAFEALSTSIRGFARPTRATCREIGYAATKSVTTRTSMTCSTPSSKTQPTSTAVWIGSRSASA
jgi:hypothetical protein